MIPVFNKKNLYQLNIPKLSGGLNLRDGLSLVNDNQLTDCQNMWFMDGVLRTRPGLISAPTDEKDMHPSKVKVRANNFNTVVIDGKTYTLEAHYYQWKRDSGEDYQSHYICFKLCSKDDSFYVGTLYIDQLYLTKMNFLPVIYKDNIYVYLRYFEDEFNTYNNEIYAFKKTGYKKYSQPEYIPYSNMYIPLVLTNCTSCYMDSGSSQAMIQKGATLVEGFNLLGSYYKMVFSMFDNTPTGYKFYPNEDGNKTECYSFMEYSLPYTTFDTPGTINVEYIDKNGTEHKHTVSVPLESNTVEYEVGADELYLHAFLKGNIVHISFNHSGEKDNYSADMLCIDEYIHNNMTVVAPCKNSDENWAKVMEMTQAIWYGNTALGVFGGSRLFLCGNNVEKDKSLVVWSDFDNPLYFSENNFAYVGDKSQRATAFGRQGSSLIVFKEKEMYDCDYSQTSVNPDELINQTAIDVTTQTAVFNFKLIHSLIGCDCPNSIQLCLNRLIWATTEGKVYTLTDRNQYSERNVFAVSLMVDKRLSKEDLSLCQSADWNGFYLLFCKNKVYAMNYNSYGYMNISAYTRNYDANQLIPWFVWHLPCNVQAVYGFDDSLKVVFVEKDGEGYLTLRAGFDFQTEFDRIKDTHLITSVVQTKIYDLDRFEKLKKINRVSALIGSSKQNNIRVDFITESGIIDTCVLKVMGTKNLNGGEYYSAKQLIPSVSLCQSFGLRFTSVDNIQIKGLSIGFKLANNIK